MPTLYYQSVRGIYHDITYSHFTYTVGDLVFYFSSEYNLTRFKERYENEMNEFRKKVEKIYWNNHNLAFDELALVRLYQKIEKRGFLLSYKGQKITCPNSIVFKTELEII